MMNTADPKKNGWSAGALFSCLTHEIGPRGSAAPSARTWAEREVADLGPPAEQGLPVPAKLAASVTINGVGFTADGHLADPSEWTRELAVTLAAAQDVTLGDAHWKVVEFARADFEAHGFSPNVRRITMGTGLSSRELYALFPHSPARTVARIAGIPKPVGCI